MCKLKKSISCFLATVVAASAFAVSAMAVSDSINPISTPYGTMNGTLTVTTSTTKKTVSGYTSCSGNCPTIKVEIDVVSYPSGTDIFDGSPVFHYNDTYVSQEAYSYSLAAITAYGSHEVRGTSSWGDYTTIVNA